MTKSQSIKLTQKRISDLYRNGNDWYYKIWDDAKNHWIETKPMNYRKTRMKRRQNLIDYANNLLGNDHVFYEGGDWKDYVKK